MHNWSCNKLVVMSLCGYSLVYTVVRDLLCTYNFVYMFLLFPWGTPKSPVYKRNGRCALSLIQKKDWFWDSADCLLRI